MVNCFKCSLPCDVDGYIALKDGACFHRACFTCELCQGGLPMKFACKNGKYYHTECYANYKANLPKCGKCTQVILATDISVAVRTERYHKRCFICDRCSLELKDDLVASISGALFHKKCVNCSVCFSTLENLAYEQGENGDFICKFCVSKRQNFAKPQQSLPQPGVYHNQTVNGSMVPAFSNQPQNPVQGFQQQPTQYGLAGQSSQQLYNRNGSNGSLNSIATASPVPSRSNHSVPSSRQGSFQTNQQPQRPSAAGLPPPAANYYSPAQPKKSVAPVINNEEEAWVARTDVFSMEMKPKGRQNSSNENLHSGGQQQALKQASSSSLADQIAKKKNQLAKPQTSEESLQHEDTRGSTGSLNEELQGRIRGLRSNSSQQHQMLQSTAIGDSVIVKRNQLRGKTPSNNDLSPKLPQKPQSSNDLYNRNSPQYSNEMSNNNSAKSIPKQPSYSELSRVPPTSSSLESKPMFNRPMIDTQSPNYNYQNAKRDGYAVAQINEKEAVNTKLLESMESLTMDLSPDEMKSAVSEDEMDAVYSKLKSKLKVSAKLKGKQDIDITLTATPKSPPPPPPMSPPPLTATESNKSSPSSTATFLDQIKNGANIVLKPTIMNDIQSFKRAGSFGSNNSLANVLGKKMSEENAIQKALMERRRATADDDDSAENTAWQ